MKKLSTIITIFALVGCVGLQNIGGAAQDLTRTEELIMAGYSIDEIEKAKASGTFNQLLSYARSSGQVQQGYERYLAGQRDNLTQYQQEQVRIKRQEQLDQQREINEREMEKLITFIEQKKSICRAYGFKEENAIATCVQTEINNEIMRMQQAQTYANAQARGNAAQRSNALSNMGRCLSTEGNFGACANAWQGYTPPKVTKCEYDVFGNVIRSTCKTQ